MIEIEINTRDLNSAQHGFAAAFLRLLPTRKTNCTAPSRKT